MADLAADIVSYRVLCRRHQASAVLSGDTRHKINDISGRIHISDDMLCYADNASVMLACLRSLLALSSTGFAPLAKLGMGGGAESALLTVSPMLSN